MPVDLNLLDGPQRAIVREAFLTSFDADALKRMLDDKLDRKLYTLVAPGPLDGVAYDLLNRARAEGWLDQLIAAAEETSGNSLVRNLRATLASSAALDLATVDARLKKTASARAGLERFVRDDGGFVNWGTWVERMAGIGRQICRVEYSHGLQISGGTGFLVAPDLILTNYHVIEPLMAARDFSRVTCRFDFAVGSVPHAPVGLAANPLVGFSPYSLHDPGDMGGLPAADQLDYALLRLAQPVGQEIVSGTPRGNVTLESATPLPAAGSILFIGQHPELNPLKLAVGAIQAANANATRVRYDANTEPGSSGSPCFNVQLKLVALHHGGDPDYKRLQGAFNQGIPTGLIVQHLAAQGIAPFWI